MNNLTYPRNLLYALSVHTSILESLTDEDFERFIDTLGKEDRQLIFLRYEKGLSLIKMSYDLKMSPEGLRKKQEKILYNLSSAINNKYLPAFLRNSVEIICKQSSDKEERVDKFNDLLKRIPLKSLGLPNRQYLALTKTNALKNLYDLYQRSYTSNGYTAVRFYRIGEVGSKKIVSVLKSLELEQLKYDIER